MPSWMEVLVKVVMAPIIEDLSMLGGQSYAAVDGSWAVKRGENASIVCCAGSQPKPTLRWFKNGEPLQMDTRIS